jgi:protein-S-isoprenylcysteine O-methyltransferase Ste14
MLRYKPPKTLRALFIVHYSPTLLIIMIGPMTSIFDIWKIPISLLFSIILGIIVFLLGTIVYFKWEIHWTKTYKGQLVIDGIFKYVRHPHYTSILIVNFGLAFFFYSTAALFISAISIPLMIWSIFDEEKLLIRQYGKKYEEFMEKTPYRIIPKIF